MHHQVAHRISQSALIRHFFSFICCLQLPAAPIAFRIFRLCSSQSEVCVLLQSMHLAFDSQFLIRFVSDSFSLLVYFLPVYSNILFVYSLSFETQSPFALTFRSRTSLHFLCYLLVFILCSITAALNFASQVSQVSAPQASVVGRHRQNSYEIETNYKF